jgi:hypothetical protein
LAHELQGLLASLVAGDFSVATKGDPAHPTVDALFEDEGAGAGGEDANAETLEGGVPQDELSGGRKRGPIHHRFGDGDRLIVRFCRHYVDIARHTLESSFRCNLHKSPIKTIACTEISKM